MDINIISTSEKKKKRQSEYTELMISEDHQNKQVGVLSLLKKLESPDRVWKNAVK